jgi:hypothetical protein
MSRKIPWLTAICLNASITAKLFSIAFFSHENVRGVGRRKFLISFQSTAAFLSF